jgi:predicted phage tail protein
LSANAFVDQVRLAASPPYNGVLGFRIERARDTNGSPGVWKRILATNTTDATTHTFTDLGLTLSNRYWYRAQFFNGLGDSPYSQPTSVRVLPPKSPININAYILRSNRILLSWLPPAANDQDGYKLERTTNAINGSELWTQIATLTNKPFLPHFVDAPIQPGSTISYRIRCFNKLGSSPFTAPFSIDIVSPPPPDLNVYAFANQAKLFWSMNYSGQLEGFILQRAPDVSGAPGDWTELAAITNSAYYAYTDAGLSPGATYWYRVRALSWTGLSDFSSPVAITIVSPAAPFNLTAQADDTNAIRLSWTAGFPFDQHGFKIERTTDVLSSWSEIATVSATNRSFSQYSDVDFVVNVTNYYRVRAFNLLGGSAYSEVADAVIYVPSDMPSEFTPDPLVTSLVLTNDDVLITWTAPAGSSVVETAPSPQGPFSSISASSRTGNTTTVGSYLDTGARTNAATRFYRIRTSR